MKENILINPQELKTEADYLELERLSLKLGIPVPMAHLEVKAELNGKVTALYDGRSRTWTRNYWNALFASVCGIPLVVTNFGAGYISMKQVSSAVAAALANTINLDPLSPVNNATRGIIPGRGAGAESFEGYTLTTPITHGAGANQLGFRAQAATGQNYNAGTKLFTATLQRLFDNTSGNTIAITETAIIVYPPSMGLYFVTCRDLLAVSVDVLNNGVLTITYIITLTFPA